MIYHDANMTPTTGIQQHGDGRHHSVSWNRPVQLGPVAAAKDWTRGFLGVVGTVLVE